MTYLPLLYLFCIALDGLVIVDSFTAPFSTSVVKKSCTTAQSIQEDFRSSRRSSTLLTLSSITATTTQQQQLPQGLTKKIITVGNGRLIKLGDIVTVQYHAYVPTTLSSIDSTTVIPMTIAQSSPKQKVIVGDGMMIPGWDVALLSMNVGERSIVRIEDSIQYGYGVKGIPPIVPPNSILEIDVQILDAEDAPRFVSSGSIMSVGSGNSAGSIEETLGVGKAGSGEWSLLDPSKPRTPEAIAAAYKLKQDQVGMAKMLINTKNMDSSDGQASSSLTLQQWIDKFKTFYFFGLFEGETGQRAPWFLRPSITFPLAFAFVGAGFYIMVSLGGISERGAQVVDELDQIIL